MSKLRDLNNRFKRLNIDSIYDNALKEVKPEILDMNTGQLAVGKYSDNTMMPSYENDDYANMKMQMGSKAPFGITNLILEGDFYRGFDMKITKNAIETYSKDSKSDDLSKEYGHEIFGLTKDNKSILGTMLKTIVQNDIKQQLNVLKMEKFKNELSAVMAANKKSYDCDLHLCVKGFWYIKPSTEKGRGINYIRTIKHKVVLPNTKDTKKRTPKSKKPQK